MTRKSIACGRSGAGLPARSAGPLLRLLALCLAAGSASAAYAQPDARQAAAIRQACATGALPPSECGGQERSAATGFPDPRGSGARTSGGQSYADPAGRYRFTVPRGWTLKVQGDLPGLTRGAAWVEVVATTATNLQSAAQAVGANFQPAFSQLQLVNQGTTQFGSHEGFGVNAEGVTRAKGQKMSVQLMAISAGGDHDLVVVSAVPVEQARALNADVVALANSVRFQGE